jgi:5,10-methylenetetrahydromethanopterin reductase
MTHAHGHSRRRQAAREHAPEPLQRKLGRVRTGLVLYHGIESGQELARYGRIAEEAGFESLWVTERLGHEETFASLGYVAAATERLRLGVGVVNTYTRHPALLAMASATLDRISGGRFVLGLGASERFAIEGRLGIPYGEPRAALRDAVGLLRELWSGAAVSRPTGRFRLNDMRLALLPIQKRLPICIAALGPKALRLAGAVADGVLLNTYSPTGYVRWAAEQVRQGAQEAGRDPAAIDVACMLSVRLTNDPARARPGQKERIVRLLCEPHTGELVLEHGGFDPALLAPLRATAQREGPETAARLVPDDLVEALFVVGPAERCRERIAEYRAAGVTLPLLLPRLEDYEATARALR